MKHEFPNLSLSFSHFCRGDWTATSYTRARRIRFRYPSAVRSGSIPSPLALQSSTQNQLQIVSVSSQGVTTLA
eukprot:scaffold115_cov304-Prasinococcus_capsulatus_cf.AAC.35